MARVVVGNLSPWLASDDLIVLPALAVGREWCTHCVIELLCRYRFSQMGGLSRLRGLWIECNRAASELK